MRESKVQIDYLGLSYYPSSAKKPEERSLDYLRVQVAKIVADLHQPVLICETGYPAAAHFGGQFAEWNLPASGYPLDDAGQARWLADLVSMIRRDPNFVGVMYFSPEWYGGGLWDAFALFGPGGLARPSVRSFKP